MPKRLAPLSIPLVLAAACAHSPLPTSFPRESAASIEASAVPSASLEVALESDPPLPGEPVGAWFGLAPRAAAPTAEHHGDHHAN